MEYPTNVVDPTKSSDEKVSFEEVGIQTKTTSFANVIRLISEKLLNWGVEERGAYRQLTISEIGNGKWFLLCLSLDRYPSCRFRGQNRNTFHQHILCVVLRHHEHGVVRPPFFHLDGVRSKLGRPILLALLKIRLGNAGPCDFWTWPSRLVSSNPVL